MREDCDPTMGSTAAGKAMATAAHSRAVPKNRHLLPGAGTAEEDGSARLDSINRASRPGMELGEAGKTSSENC